MITKHANNCAEKHVCLFSIQAELSIKYDGFTKWMDALALAL